MIVSRQWIGMSLCLSGTLAEHPIGPKGCFCCMNDVSCLVKPQLDIGRKSNRFQRLLLISVHIGPWLGIGSQANGFQRIKAYICMKEWLSMFVIPVLQSSKLNVNDGKEVLISPVDLDYNCEANNICLGLKDKGIVRQYPIISLAVT